VKQNSASAAAGRGSLHSRATHLLDGVYFDGHIVWVNHCAKMLDGRFKAQLLKEFIDVADSVALSTKIRMSWLGSYDFMHMCRCIQQTNGLPLPVQTTQKRKSRMELKTRPRTLYRINHHK
jgi:hypothetical protein